jgi:hypothetical protein
MHPQAGEVWLADLGLAAKTRIKRALLFALDIEKEL